MNNEIMFRFTENNQILQNIHAYDPKSNAFLNPDLLSNITNMYQSYDNDFVESLKNQYLIGKS